MVAKNFPIDDQKPDTDSLATKCTIQTSITENNYKYRD